MSIFVEFLQNECLMLLTQQDIQNYAVFHFKNEYIMQINQWVQFLTNKSGLTVEIH